jgi:hypothetical protein
MKWKYRFYILDGKQWRRASKAYPTSFPQLGALQKWVEARYRLDESEKHITDLYLSGVRIRVKNGEADYGKSQWVVSADEQAMIRADITGKPKLPLLKQGPEADAEPTGTTLRFYLCPEHGSPRRIPISRVDDGAYPQFANSRQRVVQFVHFKAEDVHQAMGFFCRFDADGMLDMLDGSRKVSTPGARWTVPSSIQRALIDDLAGRRRIPMLKPNDGSNEPPPSNVVKLH